MAKMNGSVIGLIADSHGNMDATEQAIRLLKERGATVLIHLGDFCDSTRRDRAGAMIRLLQDRHVLAVKGNNDFYVENRLTDDTKPSNPEEMAAAAYLQALPFTRSLDGLLFAHSLPYSTIRSFYEPIDTGGTRQAEKLFNENTFQILFCGHSHLPVIFHKRGSQVTRELSQPGEKRTMRIGGETADKKTDGISPDRFIVIVGAAEAGECALYDARNGIYERMRIFSDATRGSHGLTVTMKPGYFE